MAEAAAIGKELEAAAARELLSSAMPTRYEQLEMSGMTVADPVDTINLSPKVFNSNWSNMNNYNCENQRHSQLLPPPMPVENGEQMQLPDLPCGGPLLQPTTTAATHLAKIQWWNTPPQPWQFNSAAAKSLPPLAITITTPKARTLSVSPHCGKTKQLTPAHQQYQSKQQHAKKNTYQRQQQFAVADAAELDNFSQQSQLLADHVQVKSHKGLLNADDEDEMLITGYRRSLWRTILCWFCICLTAGILRLIMHWWRHWYLIATHKSCDLQVAEKVLIEENYEGKHKVFYVKTIQNVTVDDLKAVLLNDNATATMSAKQANTQQSPTTGHTSGCGAPPQEPPVAQIGSDEADLYLTLHFTSAEFKTSHHIRIFNCKQLRYAWDNQTQAFQKLKGLDVNISNLYYHKQKGLTRKEQLSRRLVYGHNEISIPYKDIKTLLFLEVLNPFYVFQIFSVILWFTYDYYYYACVIVLMSVFGVSMSIMQTKKNQDALRTTVQNTGSALVLGPNGDVFELPTKDIVPGDIIEIPTKGCIMQCDAVLLSGNCILDESMLTGESVPVTKTPLPKKRDIIYDKKEHARHTLFCGTKVIQTRYFGSEKVIAMVTNTGNITAKGGLVRSILYPPPVDYKFEQDSYKFIECLALIALIGFTYTLVSKIMRNVPGWKIAIESLDLITIVVPPALPAAMTVGRFYAQRRLERQSIYCISPRSINVAGSIDCCCFDKTGTLTEDGLDMWGVVPKSVTNQFQIPIRQIDRLPVNNFLFGMATCHSITIMDGKRVGDPLDLKMFESTGWIMEDASDVDDSQKYGLLHPTVVRQPKHSSVPDSSDETVFNELPTIAQSHVSRQRLSSVDDLLSDVGLLDGKSQNDHGIVREFPFTSGLQRMSVITRRLSEKNFNVYCKGSPEMLQQLCQPHSLPTNYTQQLAIFAKQGYRIIAMAYKPLNRKINYTKVQRLTREVVESDLEFLGFVIMENRLKPDTTKVIHSLNTANIRTVMVTGDNILTALSVARDCGIVTTTQAVVTVHHRKLNDLAAGDAKSASAPVKQKKYELFYTLEPGSPLNENPTANINGKAVRSSSNVNGGMSSLASTLISKSYDGGEAGNSTILTTLPLSNSLCSVEDIADDKDDTTESITSIDIELDKRLASNNISAGASTASTPHSLWRHNYRFAMTGETWQIARDNFPDELAYFVTRGAIFARMSPEAKQNLIMELQHLGYCVAMCGDGANDCGALKVAHTGISLSETESSIASPFTSCNPTIACVPSVIKEGRAALVTSFGIFKYMAAYSLVQFVSVMILYSIDSNLTDKQYLYIDLGLISVFAFFFGKTAAYGGALHKRVPLNSLISLMPLASLIMHLLVVIVFQIAGWYQLHGQSWFVPFTFQTEEHMGCHENYTMFSISSFQYIILAFVFSKGAPYRKPIWSNLPFCLSLAINLAVVIYLVLYPPPWLADFFQLVMPPEMTFRYWMLLYGLAAFVLHCMVEMLLVEMLLFKITTKRERNQLKYAQVDTELEFFYKWPAIENDQCEKTNCRRNGVHQPSALAAEYNCGKDDKLEVIETPNYVELSVQQNFDVTTPTPTGLNSFFP